MSVLDEADEHRARLKDCPPNPGSPEAYALGCKCPILDNGHGRGSGWGPGKFWINGDCPMHGVKPAADRCPKCGRIMLIGMWPSCNGDPRDHEGAVHYGWSMKR